MPLRRRIFGPWVWVIFWIREEALRVHLAAAQRHRLHRYIVDRRHRAMLMGAMVMMVVAVVTMLMIMVMMVVVVIAIGAADMVVMALLKEMRIVFERALQVEGALIEHASEIDARAAGLVDAGGRVDGADDILDHIKFFRGHEVALVDDDDIGEGDLVLGLAAVLQAQRQVLGIDEGDDGVELGLGAHVIIHEEGLGDRHWIGKARRFDDDAVEAAGTAHQAFDDADQVAAHRATDAAIVHLVDFLVRLDDQVVVDADFAEFIDDDRIFLAVIFGENAVEQRRLAGAEITGEHGNGNGLQGGDRVGHENL